MVLPALNEAMERIQTLPIPEERLVVLHSIRDVLQQKGSAITGVHFICTHNSRRSILAQVWATAFNHRYGLQYAAFSGGTEATAFNPYAAEALRRDGFEITHTTGTNPLYRVHYSSQAPALEVFSKRFDHPANPASQFIALMTCSDAETNCPFIPGANARLGLRYDDPKVFDTSTNPVRGYQERSNQIASELNWLFAQLASK